MCFTKLIDIIWDSLLFSIKSGSILYVIMSIIFSVGYFLFEGTIIGFGWSLLFLPLYLVTFLLPFFILLLILRITGLWPESLNGSQRAWIFAITTYALLFISIIIDFDSIYKIENTTDDFIVSCVILIIWTPIFLLIPKHLLERYTSEDEEDE